MRRRFLNNKESFNYRDYMTIEALVDGVTVIMPQNVEYNIGEGWVTIKSGVYTPALSKGQYISFRGHLLSGRFGTIQMNGSCSLRGNCMSLIGKSSLHPRVFTELFENCPIIEVESGFLPATTLADNCYNSMFSGCTSLTTAPALPATTLAANCYYYMFSGCTSLVNAPALPATTLADACYWSMFSGCSSLNYIKMLATDISATDCLYCWTYRVSSTGTFVKSKDATWDTTPGALGTSGVPVGWTVVNDGEEGNVGSGGEITFYVNEVEFKALDGMTWQAYVDSDYNYTVKDGNNFDNWKFIISVNNGIEEPEFYDEDYEAHWPIYTNNYQVQISSDKIIANKQYYSD